MSLKLLKISMHSAHSFFGHRLTTWHLRLLIKALHHMKTVSTWISMYCLWREDSFTVNTLLSYSIIFVSCMCRSVKMYCRFCLIKWISLYVFYVCNLYFLLAIIGPPIIFLSGCGHCLNISISLPSESMKVDQTASVLYSVSFNISWKKAGQNEVSIPVKIVFLCAQTE